MHRCSRPLAVFVLASAALFVTGCGGAKDKVVGKWKLTSVKPKDGPEQSLEKAGMTMIMEFTADGTIKAGVDASSLPPQLKEMMEKNPEAAAKMNEMQTVGKYKVSGSSIEFVDMKNSGDSPFGKKQGGKLSFDGDTMTMTADDVVVKFTRAK